MKFHENRPASSGEEDFWVVFAIYIGLAAILVMWPGFRYQIFIISTHGCSTKISVWLAMQFQKRRSLKSVYGQQTGQEGQEMTLT